MGATQRMAAVAAVSHSRLYYNHTTPRVHQTEPSGSNINFYFASGTLCGVLVMVWVACWRRKSSSVKTEDVDVAECRGVYTVSADSMLSQEQMDLPGPPPAYETVVKDSTDLDKDHHTLEEVVSEPHPLHAPQRRDCELPSYEAAVLLKDTKL